MKKTLIILAVFLALVGWSAWFIFKDQKPNEEEQRAFQTPNLQELTKIELKDRQGNLTQLTYMDSQWLVEERYPVSKVTLNDLFYALEHMEVAYPAPTVAIDNVLTQMVANSTKVSLYREGENKPFKVFVVGGPTHDQDGTYMLMEIDGDAAERPYVVNLPGFRGYITYRFSAIKNYWIGTQFTKLLAEEIDGIELNYHQEDSLESFVLGRGVNGFFMQQKDSVVQEDLLQMDMLEGYYNAFMNLSFELYLDSLPKQDSIMANMRYADLTLSLKNGETKKLNFYLKPFPQQPNLPLDQSGNALRIDPDKLYAFDHESQSFFTVQYYTFGKLFVKVNQFKK